MSEFKILRACGTYVLKGGGNEPYAICYGPDAEENAVEIAEVINERRLRRSTEKSGLCKRKMQEQVTTVWGEFGLAEIDDAC